MASVIEMLGNSESVIGIVVTHFWVAQKKEKKYKKIHIKKIYSEGIKKK
jgi:predicted glycosyltransferase involved in capsule biosynthesis